MNLNQCECKENKISLFRSIICFEGRKEGKERGRKERKSLAGEKLPKFETENQIPDATESHPSVLYFEANRTNSRRNSKSLKMLGSSSPFLYMLSKDATFSHTVFLKTSAS